MAREQWSWYFWLVVVVASKLRIYWYSSTHTKILSIHRTKILYSSTPGVFLSLTIQKYGSTVKFYINMYLCARRLFWGVWAMPKIIIINNLYFN